jgi:hypothetical protein
MSDDTGSPAADAPRDKFYRGRIKKLFHGTEMGIVRSGNGRELPFTFRHVTRVGGVRRFDELREGMSVGFDVGWTSKGLVVTVLQTEE